MRKIKYISKWVFILFISSAFLGHSPSEPSNQEAEMHYKIAEKNLKNNNYGETIRLLNEIIGYYDTRHIKAYKLLIKTYKKAGKSKQAREVKERLRRIKKYKKKSKKIDIDNLTPVEVLKIGMPRQRIQAIRKIDNKRHIPELIEALKDPFYNYYFQRYEVREAALDKLVEFKQEALSYLKQATDSKNEDIRWWSLKTISEICKKKPEYYKEVKNMFLKALDDNFDQVKIVGIKTTKERKDKEATPKLIKLISEGSNTVKYESAKAVAELCSPEDKMYDKAVKVLNNLIESKDKILVNQGIKSISKIGKANAEDLLLEIARDKNRPTITRWYAVKGLGEILSKEDNTEKLEEFLSSDNFWLRSAASVALGKSVHRQEDDKLMEKRKEIKIETAKKFSLESTIVYEEARRDAVYKGIKYLESIQKEDGRFPSFYPLGTTELAVLRFMEHGYEPEYPAVKKAISFILKHKKRDGSFFMEEAQEGSGKVSYTTALAVNVLAGTHDAKYKYIIKDAVEWLKDIQNPDGGFGYYKGSRSDITCTSYVIRALDQGYRYWGWKRTDETWIKVLDYLKELQNKDGGFGYSEEMDSHSYGSATADGMIGLLKAGASDKKIKKGLKWISENYTWEVNPHYDKRKRDQYYVQALAAALDLTGKETIKDGEGNIHNWYHEAVQKMLREQSEQGWWKTSEEPLFTTYMLKVLQLKRLKQSIESL
ncbi:MAG: prenyltransferase/squalene oxidase repeat-containing protein [Elusimicrobiota bacterium]